MISLRGTRDEESSHVRVDPTVRFDGKAPCSASSSNPMMEDAMGLRRGYCIPIVAEVNRWSTHAEVERPEPNGTLIALLRCA